MEAVQENILDAKSSTLERILAAAAVVGGAGGALYVKYFDPVTQGLFPVCPLFKLTGLHCPGCGMTRGFHALFNGDILGALDYNILIPVFAVIFGYAGASLFATAMRGRGLPFKMIPTSSLWVLMIVMLAFGVLRNLPFYPLSLLAP